MKRQYTVLTIVIILLIGGGYLFYFRGGNEARCVSPNTPQTVGLIRCTAETELGFVLFQPLTSNTTFLIDSEGNQINSWDTDEGFRPVIAHLFSGGDIVQASDEGSRVEGLSGVGITGILERIGWDGTIRWRLEIADNKLRLHDDIEVLDNGNILALAWEHLSPEEASAVGFDPKHITADGLWSDTILEIKPNNGDDFEIVWQWRFLDHLVQDRNPNLRNYGVIAEQPEKLDVNFERSSEREASGTLLHCNGIDYRNGLDQVLVSCDFTDEIYIIDHTSGELLYRFGNPAIIGRGTLDERTLKNPHDAQWLDDNTILLFNNNKGGVQSAIIELSTPLAEDGTYRRENGAFAQATVTREIELAEDLQSDVMSGVQQLPGGNLLVTSAETGTIVQLAEDGKEVWRYVVPIGADGNIISAGNSDEPKISLVSKARWYPSDYLNDFLFNLYSEYYDDYLND